MSDSKEEAGWQGNLLRRILSVITKGGLVLILQNLIEAWALIDRFRDRIGYHGMYEILDSTISPHLTFQMQRARKLQSAGVR